MQLPPTPTSSSSDLSETPHILVTGGTGYIGSHTVLELLNSGYRVVVFDNLSNSSQGSLVLTLESLRRVEFLTGKECEFVLGDLLSTEDLSRLFRRFQISTVIHFAGLKAVGESCKKPLEYYMNNVTGTLNLLAAMQAHNVSQIIYSSSATVYGDPAVVPIPEECPTGPTSPYGRSKLFVEEILRDYCTSHPNFSATILRYFNPAGAHSSGMIGEDPTGIPNNLMPFVAQVAIGKLPQVNVFGSDYATPDGTGVRDYIHVVDLAKGHVSAVLQVGRGDGFKVFNLGTGKGYSVLEMIHAMRLATSKPIPAKVLASNGADY